MADAPLVHPLRFSAIVGASFSAYGRAPVAFVVLGILGQTPSIVDLVVDPSGVASFSVSYLVFALTTIVVPAIVEPAVVVLAVRALEGTPRISAEVVDAVRRRALPNIAVSLLQWLLFLLGIVLLIVPGVYAAVVLAVATPVCVLERLGPRKSLGRSVELVKGRGWLVLSVMAFLFSDLAWDTMIDRLSVLSPAVQAWSKQVFEVLWTPFTTILAVALYLALLRKGQPPAARLTEVF